MFTVITHINTSNLHANMQTYMIQLPKHQEADKSQKKKKITHPSSIPSLSLPSSLHPPTPPLPRETLGIGSDSSPPLMLACMNVKSLQACSAHPRWETLQEESSMSEPILACLPLHGLLFLLFVFFLSSFALLPWGVTINWPFICKREKKRKHQCWFQKRRKKDCSTSLTIYSFSAANSSTHIPQAVFVLFLSVSF